MLITGYFVAKSVRSSGLANLKVSMGCSAFPFRLELGFFWPLCLSKIFSVISVLILCFRFAMSWIISLWFRNRLDNGERGTNRSIRLLVTHWWACRKKEMGFSEYLKLINLYLVFRAITAKGFPRCGSARKKFQVTSRPKPVERPWRENYSTSVAWRSRRWWVKWMFPEIGVPPKHSF